MSTCLVPLEMKTLSGSNPWGDSHPKHGTSVQFKRQKPKVGLVANEQPVKQSVHVSVCLSVGGEELLRVSQTGYEDSLFSSGGNPHPVLASEVTTRTTHSNPIARQYEAWTRQQKFSVSRR